MGDDVGQEEWDLGKHEPLESKRREIWVLGDRRADGIFQK